MVAARTSPTAPAARLVRTTAASASTAPPGVTLSRAAGSRISATASACTVPSSVAPKTLPSAMAPRGTGATSSMRSPPASRSVTVLHAQHPRVSVGHGGEGGEERAEEDDHPEQARSHVARVVEARWTREHRAESRAGEYEPHERPRHAAHQPPPLAQEPDELAGDDAPDGARHR